MSDDLVARLREPQVTISEAMRQRTQAAAEIERLREENKGLRGSNSSFASQTICHGNRENNLWTCPKAPCDYCLQWQRQRAERAEADGKAAFDLSVECRARAVKAEAERDALREDAERYR